MRCFIAVPLPEQVQNSIGKLESELKKFNADISWSRPEGIHLTLKFLGEISEDKIQPIVAILTKILSAEKPFDISIGGTGVFPNERKARILWLGIRQGENNLIRLAEQLENELVELGFAKEERRFHPHLTLCRVRSAKNLSSLTDYYLNNINPDLGIIRINEIYLYQSVLRATGAVYTILRQAKFGIIN